MAIPFGWGNMVPVIVRCLQTSPIYVLSENVISPVSLSVFPCPRALEVWGDDTYGVVSGVPVGTHFVQVSAGMYHVLALGSNGFIYGWGDNSTRQVSDASVDGGFIQVSAGGNVSAALDRTGNAHCWGYDGWGFVIDAPLGSGIFQVEIGVTIGPVLFDDGSIEAWGAGQTDHPSLLLECFDIQPNFTAARFSLSPNPCRNLESYQQP